MKKKISDLLEGENSSLRKTFDEATSQEENLKGEGKPFVFDEKTHERVIGDMKEVFSGPSQEQELRESIGREIDFGCEHWVKGDDVPPFRFGGWREEIIENIVSKFSSLRAADREALQLAYLKAFGNYVPLSSEDSEPEKMAETVMKVWSEKVQEETREALVREIEKFKNWNQSDEFKRTVKLAEKLLDEPWADPDDDLRMLSRQFVRATERFNYLLFSPSSNTTQPQHQEMSLEEKARINAILSD